MAILQISRIQVRRGLQENLPQLAEGEMGWALDSRQVYIGNGSSIDTPLPGESTRILTELDLSAIIQSLGNVSLAGSQITPNIALIVEPTLSSTIINYSIWRDLDKRTGIMKIASNGSTVSYVDDYVESSSLGISLTPNISIVPGSITLTYTSTAGNAATLITSSVAFT